MSRPSMDEVLLEIAAVMATRGTCSTLQVGAVIARDGRILASGYNGSARGLPHCVHPPRSETELGDATRATCSTSVHAEANAVAFAARHGVALNGATLYVTASPCVPCAQLVVNAGIVQVIAGQLYRVRDGVDLMSAAGVRVLFFDPRTRGVTTIPPGVT